MLVMCQEGIASEICSHNYQASGMPAGVPEPRPWREEMLPILPNNALQEGQFRGVRVSRQLDVRGIERSSK